MTLTDLIRKQNLRSKFPPPPPKKKLTYPDWQIAKPIHWPDNTPIISPWTFTVKTIRLVPSVIKHNSKVIEFLYPCIK